jgi:hypothetical protein
MQGRRQGCTGVRECQDDHAKDGCAHEHPEVLRAAPACAESLTWYHRHPFQSSAWFWQALL